MKFEWDPAKDRANQAKHGLSFEQASKLFEESADLLEVSLLARKKWLKTFMS